MPRPATRTTTPPARIGSRSRCSASEARSAAAPRTATWLPTSTWPRKSGAASSAPSDRRKDNGQTGWVVARRRRHAHHGHQTEDQRASPPRRRRSGSAGASRAGRCGPPPAERGDEATVDRRPASASPRTPQAWPAADVRGACRAAPTRCRPAPTCSRDRRAGARITSASAAAREPTRREHRVGPRVGAALLTRRAASSSASAGRPPTQTPAGQQVRHVDRRWRPPCPAPPRRRGWRRRRSPATRPSSATLAARRPPVARDRQVSIRTARNAPSRSSRPPRTSQTMPPWVCSEHADDRGAIERRAGPSPPGRPSGRPPRSTAVSERDEDEQPPGTARIHDLPAAAPSGRSDGPARSSMAAPPTRRTEDARCSQRARSATVTAPSRSSLRARCERTEPLADDITRSVGLPMVTVIFVVAAGRVTSVP